ncbi:lipoprotein putative [Vibrio astriarenae]|nr:lipoprotein putative [Vibrio sp. C7]
MFDDATFEDMKHPDRPLIMIGASDLARGVRFTFVQEYFDLICSDLSSFPVARAVTASSAVPVLFNPIVLENHDGCHDSNLLQISTEPSVDDIQSRHTVAGLLSYGEKAERKYIHLVDGGITDNLGVLSFSDLVQAAGGDEDFLDK